ncbi:MAG: S41 family peptidase [Eubacteriales bacterium]|nr:S41 family peptidase [Eubacteriales bacterium]
MVENGQDRGFVKGLLCGVVLVLLCMCVMLGWYQFRWEQRTANEQAQTKTGATQEERALALDTKAISGKLAEIEKLINDRYLTEVDEAAIEDGIYGGMVAALGDPYSIYYSKKELKNVETSTNGSYVGIGLTLSENKTDGTIRVESCFKDSPAYRAGIEIGDIIVSLNGERLSDIGMNLTELVEMIREEEEERFTLGLVRGESSLEVEVTRENIELQTVEAKMLEGNIGYLHILEFDNVTEEQFQTALQQLEDEGMEKLIVDVRDNPGGVLGVVCSILDLMLPEGRIVYTEDKNGVEKEYFSDEEHQFTKPLAVLINENSASASEIFAGAVKDYGMGTLVGTTTFGKGIVQRIFTLSDGTGMKLTVAKYYTPGGTDIHEKGITPDVEVELDEELAAMEDILPEKDTQLQKAIAVLK